MFAPRYFPQRHFAPRYFPPGIGVVVAEVEYGGNQFLVFRPILEPLESQIPVGKEVMPYLRMSDTDFIIDGKKYDLVEQRTPQQILADTPNLGEILDEAVEKMGITRRNAKKELYNQIIKSLKDAEGLKESVFSDDEEIIYILVATDDL
jgi:hypothetical protein